MMSCLTKSLLTALTACSFIFATTDSTAGNHGNNDDYQTARRVMTEIPPGCRHSNDNDISSVAPFSCSDCFPDINYWIEYVIYSRIFGYSDRLDQTRIIWTTAHLEQLSFRQLITLAKDGDIDSENLLWIPFSQFFKQKQN